MLTPDPACQHKRTQLIAKDEDAQYVECLDCGEVFDSNEFHDMAIEEKVEEESEQDTQ